MLMDIGLRIKTQNVV